MHFVQFNGYAIKFEFDVPSASQIKNIDLYVGNFSIWKRFNKSSYEYIIDLITSKEAIKSGVSNYIIPSKTHTIHLVTKVNIEYTDNNHTNTLNS